MSRVYWNQLSSCLCVRILYERHLHYWNFDNPAVCTSLMAAHIWLFRWLQCQRSAVVIVAQWLRVRVGYSNPNPNYPVHMVNGMNWQPSMVGKLCSQLSKIGRGGIHWTLCLQPEFVLYMLLFRHVLVPFTWYEENVTAVSYTHLTLPTTVSV